MRAIIRLTKKECYKPFDKFYEMIYEKVNNGKKLSNTAVIKNQRVFATPAVLQEIFDFYDVKMGAELDEINLLFLQFSPAELYYKEDDIYTIRLEEGWCEE